jgi:hypothetical protein
MWVFFPTEKGATKTLLGISIRRWIRSIQGHGAIVREEIEYKDLGLLCCNQTYLTCTNEDPFTKKKSNKALPTLLDMTLLWPWRSSDSFSLV